MGFFKNPSKMSPAELVEQYERETDSNQRKRIAKEVIKRSAEADKPLTERLGTQGEDD